MTACCEVYDHFISRLLSKLERILMYDVQLFRVILRRIPQESNGGPTSHCGAP